MAASVLRCGKPLVACRLQKQIFYVSKVFGYYNCVTILTMQFHECTEMERIHAVGADI